jgi:hypothetical protein
MKNKHPESTDWLLFGIKVAVIGIISGFIGMITFAYITPPTSLSGDILNAMLAGLFTMTVAIIIVVYQHKRQR